MLSFFRPLFLSRSASGAAWPTYEPRWVLLHEELRLAVWVLQRSGMAGGPGVSRRACLLLAPVSWNQEAPELDGVPGLRGSGTQVPETLLIPVWDDAHLARCNVSQEAALHTVLRVLRYEGWIEPGELDMRAQAPLQGVLDRYQQRYQTGSVGSVQAPRPWSAAPTALAAG